MKIKKQPCAEVPANEKYLDSREKLEIDVRKRLAWNGSARTFPEIDEAFGWLDRQAAITTQELVEFLSEHGVHVSYDGLRNITTVEIGGRYSCSKCAESSNPALALSSRMNSKELIDRLVRERDDLQERCDNQQRELHRYNEICDEFHLFKADDGEAVCSCLSTLYSRLRKALERGKENGVRCRELERERDELKEKVKDQSQQLADVQGALEKRNTELKPQWKKKVKELKDEILKYDKALDEVKKERDEYKRLWEERETACDECEEACKNGLPTDPGEAALAGVEAHIKEKESEQDSREKLEIDAYNLTVEIQEYANELAKKIAAGKDSLVRRCFKHDVMQLLDRQAAITFQEEREEYEHLYDFLSRIGQKCGTKDCPSLISYVEQLEAKIAACDSRCANCKYPNHAAEVKALLEKQVAELTEQLKGYKEQLVELEENEDWLRFERDQLKQANRSLQKQLFAARNTAKNPESLSDFLKAHSFEPVIIPIESDSEITVMPIEEYIHNIISQFDKEVIKTGNIDIIGSGRYA